MARHGDTVSGREMRRLQQPPESKSKGIVARAMHEVFTNEPSTVTRANVSGERKRKMKVAIALAKARKAGARIPRKGR